ncbi:quinolinate synthase NadA [Salirhabdus salicampi]|uniref:quinolinate synthase NadA n=1 Tax=Salirhabdus salicampi TaxID=476102 RepID=UPI0020C56CB7|nr:quinolinate synthase NadA [Salirhabdus salicampi]MCP8615970.1 quinolinate synthase NadA [Salirhabdus salicampi]
MNVLDVLEPSQIPNRYKEMSDQELEIRAKQIKKKLGPNLYIPGHHYQKDEVLQFADDTGDSLQLAQMAEKNQKAKYIVFCGVHFMAETADILTNEDQTVVLPDMRAGCSMADMADIHQTIHAWEELQNTFDDTIMPLTYVNSTASIKSFVGKHGGATVTSSNAKRMIKWALSQKKRILFLPDQHLGRNVSYELGVPLEQMAVWDPLKKELIYEGDKQNILVILWKGHCSVHEKFTVEHIHALRSQFSDMNVIVHPECTFDVVQAADTSGSTKEIIDAINHAPKDSRWAIGTEMNLVNRLIKSNPDKHIVSLNPNMCPCLTMNRIDLPHFVWALDMIEMGKPVNEIKVEDETAHFARLALQRMLERV